MPKKKRKHTGPSLASQADKYELYQKSVQEPTCEVDFFHRVFKRQFGRTPLMLREDFCGTAAVCCEWVKSRHDRQAIGVDLDPEPVQWCRDHTFASLKEDAQSRITFVCDDCRKPLATKADVLAAQNFSFFLFTTRDSLREYFAAALANLGDEGILVLDMMGGSEVMLDGHADKRKKKGFTYIWDQELFDPITHHCRFHIHFKFPDGSKLKRAFTYDWRLWTLPEVQELLLEAGFDSADVYWEGVDKDGEGDGVYRKRKQGTADPSWIAYVVGVKRATC
jgi:hypothetical protein